MADKPAKRIKVDFTGTLWVIGEPGEEVEDVKNRALAILCDVEYLSNQRRRTRMHLRTKDSVVDNNEQDME